MPEDNTVLMEGVRLVFRNFEGREGRFNQEGSRNFAVLLDDDVAEQMARDGWNVKYLQPREVDEGEDEHADAYIPVKVGYKGRPPRVVLISSRGRTDLGESEVAVLDHVDIANVDLIIRPNDWEVNGKTGRKAYLKTIYVTINEDALELKYGDVPVAGKGPVDRDDFDISDD